MKNAITAAALLGLTASPALAQVASPFADARTDTLGLEAGFTLTVPLGATDTARRDQRARLDFGLASTRVQGFADGRERLERAYLFSLGADETGLPRLQLGQSELGPLAFPAAYADEPDTPDTPAPVGTTGSQALLIVGGGLLVAVGAVALTNEAKDSFEDGFRCAIDQVVPGEDTECKT